MAIFLSQRWARQPQYQVGLNWANPLTAGLTAWQSGLFYRPAWTLTNTAPGYGTTAAGQGLSFTSANNTLLERTTSSAQDACTLLAIVRLPAGQNANRIILQYSTADLFEVASLYYNNTNQYLFQVTNFNTSQTGTAQSTVTLSGEVQTLIGRQTGQTYRDLWIDGIVRATDTATASATINTARIGRSSGGDGFSGTAILLAFWARGLTDSEVVEVSRNPWQLFSRATSPVIYSLPLAPTYSLALDAGSYSLTGQDVTLTFTANAPVLSAATVFDITSTSATPRVTVTF